MKITIELPDDLHKALKSDFAAQVISEKFLGLELSASSKVAHLVLQAAQQSVQLTGGIQRGLEADTTPEDLSGLEADTTPPTSN